MKNQSTLFQLACATAALTLATLPVAFAGDGAGCDYDKAAKITENAGGEMQKVSLTVKGMTCGSCVEGVKKALNGVDGVKTASVDLGNGTAAVELESGKANADTLTAALKKAGYDAAVAAN